MQPGTGRGNFQAVGGRIQPVRAAISLAAALALILFSGVVFGQSAEETEAPAANSVTAGVESDFNSRDVWHGIVSSSAGVLQNCAWASVGPLTGEVWVNCDLAAEPEVRRLYEYDFVTYLAWSYRSLSLETAVQAYVYPRQPETPNTVETSFDLSWTSNRIQPFVIYTFDIKAYSGASFGEVGLRSAWEMGETVCLETAAGIGWGSARFNETYIGLSATALNMISADAAVSWNCWRGFSVRPHLLATRLLDDRLRAMVDHPSFIQIGVAIGGGF